MSRVTVTPPAVSAARSSVTRCARSKASISSSSCAARDAARDRAAKAIDGDLSGGAGWRAPEGADRTSADFLLEAPFVPQDADRLVLRLRIPPAGGGSSAGALDVEDLRIAAAAAAVLLGR